MMMIKSIFCLFLLITLLAVSVSSLNTEMKGTARPRKNIIKELREKVARLEAQMETNRLLMCGSGMQKHVTLPTTDANIKDDQLTASSYFGYLYDYDAAHGRLFGETGSGSWVAKEFKNQWIQVDLKKDTTIYGIATQGRPFLKDHWVTAYTVWYQPDGSRTFHPVLDDSEQPMLFRGNKDRNTPVTNDFTEPITARVFRIKVKDYHYHIAMRFDLLTC